MISIVASIEITSAPFFFNGKKNRIEGVIVQNTMLKRRSTRQFDSKLLD